jgi:hypothetical protein
MLVRPSALTMVFLVTAFAGCLEGETPLPPGSDDACRPGGLSETGTRLLSTTDDPIKDDRSLQWDHESYNARTCSLPAIGHNVLNATGVPHKYIGELDMHGEHDLGAVAVLGSREKPRVYLLDIKDRANPKVLSMIEQSGTYIVDVKITEDGKFLYTASQATAAPEITARPTEPLTPVGFSVYNIQDRAKPKYIGTVVDSGAGCHMMSLVQVASNQDAVFCISAQLRSYLIQRDNDRILNLGFVPYSPTPSQAGGAGLGPHDTTVFHEGGKFRAGKSYQVVSYLNYGVRVLDITDAPVVKEVGSWMGQGAKHYHGAVHTAMMFRVGDHRYIAATPEYTNAAAKEVPSVWVLDADDLSNLKLIGEWYHPNEHAAQGLYLTLHQWQVAPTGKDLTPDQVRIYITYNHAGIWVLDLGKILAHDNAGAILGFNSARTPIEPEKCVPNSILSTWDVGVVDGHIYGTDRCTGLWVFHYEGDRLGDERVRGFA